MYRKNQELDVYLAQPKEWTPAEKKKLKKAVREDAIRERMKNIMVTKEELMVRGKSKHASKEDKQAILEQLRELKEQSDTIRSMPDDELFHNREEDFDWMRISAQTVSSNLFCFLILKHFIHQICLFSSAAQ